MVDDAVPRPPPSYDDTPALGGIHVVGRPEMGDFFLYVDGDPRPLPRFDFAAIVEPGPHRVWMRHIPQPNNMTGPPTNTVEVFIEEGTAVTLHYEVRALGSPRLTRGRSRPLDREEVALGSRVELATNALGHTSYDVAELEPPLGPPVEGIVEPPDAPAGSGWFRDPTERHDYRWWDGHGWSVFVSDDGYNDVDPP